MAGNAPRIARVRLYSKKRVIIPPRRKQRACGLIYEYKEPRTPLNYAHPAGSFFI